MTSQHSRKRAGSLETVEIAVSFVHLLLEVLGDLPALVNRRGADGQSAEDKESHADSTAQTSALVDQLPLLPHVIIFRAENGKSKRRRE